jgi:cobalt-zinc-cadmium efflux system membrane fusion protein
MNACISRLNAISVLAFILLGCGDKGEAKKEENHKENSEVVILSAESVKQIKLETMSVSLQPFADYLIIPARVITSQDNEARIGSLVQGRVYQVYAKVGDYVREGQVLMTLEGLDIGEIKAGFLKTKAALEYAKANFERQKKLFDEKIGSQKALLESQAEYEKALAEFEAEDERIHSVGLNDEDVANGKNGEEHTSGTLPIKSQINGIVVERNVVIGQFIDATTNAFTIINTNTVWIDGQIYEKDLAKITRKTDVLFTAAAYQNEKFNGRIIYIGQTVDEQSRTITIRGEFSNPYNKLKPNMFGELKVPHSTKTDAIMIPNESVVKETGQEYVFIQTNATTFKKRTVITGASVGNMIEIKDGLKAGDTVVSKGVFYLKSELKKDEIAGDEH